MADETIKNPFADLKKEEALAGKKDESKDEVLVGKKEGPTVEKKEEALVGKPASYPEAVNVGGKEVKEGPRAEEAKKKCEDALNSAREILKDYGGLPSNIPWNSAYWAFMNEHQDAYEQWKRLSPLGL